MSYGGQPDSMCLYASIMKGTFRFMGHPIVVV